MKLIVVDNVTYIGSANFDARSLFLNVEMMVRIADAEFATRMRDFVAGLEPDCEVITRQSQRARAGLLTLLCWTLAWFVVGVSGSTVSRRTKFGLSEQVWEIT